MAEWQRRGVPAATSGIRYIRAVAGRCWSNATGPESRGPCSTGSTSGTLCRPRHGGEWATERVDPGASGGSQGSAAGAIPGPVGRPRQRAYVLTRRATVLPPERRDRRHTARCGGAIGPFGARMSPGAQAGANDCGSGRRGRGRTAPCAGGDSVSRPGSKRRRSLRNTGSHRPGGCGTRNSIPAAISHPVKRNERGNRAGIVLLFCPPQSRLTTLRSV